MPPDAAEAKLSGGAKKLCFRARMPIRSCCRAPRGGDALPYRGAGAHSFSIRADGTTVERCDLDPCAAFPAMDGTLRHWPFSQAPGHQRGMANLASCPSSKRAIHGTTGLWCFVAETVIGRVWARTVPLGANALRFVAGNDGRGHYTQAREPPGSAGPGRSDAKTRKTGHSGTSPTRPICRCEDESTAIKAQHKNKGPTGKKVRGKKE